MAYTKKTTKSAAAQTPVVTEEATPVVKEVEKPKTAVKHSANDMINCRSITVGEMILIGLKSGDFYDFIDYGDEVAMRYEDLIAAVRARRSYIFNPMFIIDDEAFIAENPKLKELYSSLYGNGDFEEILDLPLAPMKDAVKSLPSGALDNFKSYAATAVNNGTLDSIKKIKALDEILHTDMTFYMNNEE